MASHSCHRILVRFEGGDTGSGIHLRVIRYHCFIHAVKSEQVSFRTPECTFINTEFLTVYTLTAYDAFGFIGYLVGFTVCCGYKQIIGNGISQRTAVFVPVLVGCFGSDGLAPYYFFLSQSISTLWVDVFTSIHFSAYGKIHCINDSSFPVPWLPVSHLCLVR